MVKDNKKENKKENKKITSALMEYAKLIENKPFVLYIMPNRQVLMIPLEEEDLTKEVVEVFGKMHEINLDKALSLTYYEPNTGQTISQPFIMLIQTNFFTLDGEDLVNRYLIAYLKDTLSVIDKINMVIEFLKKKIKNSRDPVEIQAITDEIEKLRHYVKQVLEKTKNIYVDKGEAVVETEHLKPATQVITPKQAKYLNPETQDLTDEEIQEVIESLYPLEENERNEENQK